MRHYAKPYCARGGVIDLHCDSLVRLVALVAAAGHSGIWSRHVHSSSSPTAVAVIALWRFIALVAVSCGTSRRQVVANGGMIRSLADARRCLREACHG